MRFLSFASAFALAAGAAASPILAQPAPAPAAAPMPAPREIAGQVAQAVEDNYFDAARAHAIAAGLRAHAAAGDYDHFADPLDLATALSAYLHPYDGHFTVVYRPEAGSLPGELRRGPPGAGGPGPGPGPMRRPGPGGPADPAARENYGFVHTEMLPGGIGYVAVNQFAEIDPAAPDDPARRAADAALQSVAGARAIILDLRDSRGGAPAMVAYLASYFVPAGAPIFNIFHTRGANATEMPTAEPTGPRRLDVPLYILVNGGTGSASESFPYTLQAARRAMILGEPTNGRANPGGFLRVAGGFAVFVSAGSPENPITHSNWEGTGVRPDIAVASAGALDRARELALQRLVAADPQGPDAAGDRWLLADMHAAAPAAIDLAAYAGSYGEEANLTADGGVLVLHQGRRAAALRPVGPDLFVSALNPLMHAQFERENGRVVAVSLVTPRGPVARFRR